jgi:hypothetical protein
MRSNLFVGFLAAVVGFMLVTNPVTAEAAKQMTGKDIKNGTARGEAFVSSGFHKAVLFEMTRCDVEAVRPQGFPMNPEAFIEASLTCDPAILPEIFNNTVCLQVKKGGTFVDNGCCKIPKTTVSTSPWLMCGEAHALLQGTHKYRTRARAFRPATGKGETDYSSAIALTL